MFDPVLKKDKNEQKSCPKCRLGYAVYRSAINWIFFFPCGAVLYVDSCCSDNVQIDIQLQICGNLTN
jgi:hypothetical protein